MALFRLLAFPLHRSVPWCPGLPVGLRVANTKKAHCAIDHTVCRVTMRVTDLKHLGLPPRLPLVDRPTRTGANANLVIHGLRDSVTIDREPASGEKER